MTDRVTGRAAALAVTGLTLAALTGCVTSTPTAQPSLAALPSLAPSLPPPPTTGTTTAATPPPSGPTTAPTRAASPTGPEADRGPSTTTRPPAAPRAATPHVPTTTELKRALLGSGDLAGFRVDAGSDSDVGGEGGCAPIDTDFSAGARAKADVLLYQSAKSTFVRERIRQLSVSGARAALDRVRGAPRACAEFTTKVAVLGEVTVTVDPLSAPRTADDTTAVRITMRPTVASVVAIENLVLIRRGGTLIIITHTGLSAIDDSITSTAVAKAYEKTKQVW
ncbi:hypothetical protein BJ973_000573 [Actinoplanes tereljensis]|uniref:Uncharacterized protein n=1 Tax=Paractinoplanes tereljensis TaxID=571912 RepID=A0A919NSB3_9ACTN|nr:hypothetical protein [Actinoplanes tereljensis]GIF23069.1 hypothetical protein Ate02nite_57990 [Actinoplanes tereljensis]